MGRLLSDPCGILAEVYPGTESASNSTPLPGQSFPGPGGNASDNGTTVPRVTFNVTYGQLRAFWSTICVEPSFVQAAANASGPENVTSELSVNGSADEVGLVEGFVWVAPCNGSVAPTNGTVPPGSACTYEELWFATYSANGSATIRGPERFENLEVTSGPGTGSGGNGTTSSSVPGSSSPYLPAIALAAAVAVVAGALVARARTRSAADAPAPLGAFGRLDLPKGPPPAGPPTPEKPARPSGAIAPETPDPLSDIF